MVSLLYYLDLLYEIHDAGIANKGPLGLFLLTRVNG